MTLTCLCRLSSEAAELTGASLETELKKEDVEEQHHQGGLARE